MTFHLHNCSQLLSLPVISHPISHSSGFPGSSAAKNPPALIGDTGDTGLSPGSGRSPGGKNANPFQYSCRDNSMERGAWWATAYQVAKSQTWLSNWTHTSHSFPTQSLEGSLKKHILSYVTSNPNVLQWWNCTTDWDSNPAWTHCLFIEITHLVSGFNDAQAVFVVVVFFFFFFNLIGCTGSSSLWHLRLPWCMWDLVSWPGFKLRTLASGVWSLSDWIT